MEKRKEKSNKKRMVELGDGTCSEGVSIYDPRQEPTQATE